MLTRYRSTVRIIALALLVAFVSSACTSTASQKLVAFPTQGQDPARQFQDRAECEQIATQNRGDEATDVATGAAGGVLLGAAGGAAIGLISGALEGTAKAGLVGLAVGGIAGLIGGALGAWKEHGRHYHSVYDACMKARGYLLGG